jgi:hypothetical protein
MMRALASVALFAVASHAAALAEQPLSVVLVHGAFVDGSGWQKVYSLLKKGRPSRPGS